MPYSPLQLADAYIQTGELADALAALTQHLDADPGDDSARRLRIGLRLRLEGDHLRAALADFDQLAAPTARDFAQRAVILERLGDLDGAAQAVEQARTLNPSDDRLTEQLLHLWRVQAKTATALDLLRSQPRTWRWLQWEGDFLVQAGDDITATARYGLALAQIDARFDVGVDKYLAPIKARILLARAHAYRRLDQIDQAENAYLEAGQLIPNDPAIPFHRGLLAYARGDLPTAIDLCRLGLTHASPTLRNELFNTLNAYPELQEKVTIK